MKKTEPLASPYTQTSIQFIKKVRSIHTRNSVRGEKYSKGIKTNPRIQGEKKRDDEYVESFHLYNEGRRRERERSVLSGERRCLMEETKPDFEVVDTTRNDVVSYLSNPVIQFNPVK